MEAVRRLLDPQPIEQVGLVLAAGLIGFAGNEAVAVYRIRVGRADRLGRDGGRRAARARRRHHLARRRALGDRRSSLGFERADAFVGLAITLAIGWTLVQAGPRRDPPRARRER